MRSRLSFALAALPLLAVTGAQQVSLPGRATALADGPVIRVQVLHDEPASPAAERRAPAPRPRAARTATRSHRTTAPPSRPRRTAAPAPTRSVATTAPRVQRSTTSRTSGYPYADDTSGGADPWGFTKRQCVSYVAWRLSQAGRPVYTRQGWGDARSWDDTARSKGYSVTTRAVVGSVAHWNAGESGPLYASGSTVANGRFGAGSLGHVAWVTKVYSDGSVQVAQYNGYGDRRYSSMRVKAPRYLRL